jgi:hypothetical protein
MEQQMKIMEALTSKNLMLVNSNRWLVLCNGSYTVFEHRFRKVTDVQIYTGADEEMAVKFLINGENTHTPEEKA